MINRFRGNLRRRDRKLLSYTSQSWYDMSDTRKKKEGRWDRDGVRTGIASVVSILPKLFQSRVPFENNKSISFPVYLLSSRAIYSSHTISSHQSVSTPLRARREKRERRSGTHVLISYNQTQQTNRFPCTRRHFQDAMTFRIEGTFQIAHVGVLFRVHFVVRENEFHWIDEEPHYWT